MRVEGVTVMTEKLATSQEAGGMTSSFSMPFLTLLTTSFRFRWTGLGRKPQTKRTQISPRTGTARSNVIHGESPRSRNLRAVTAIPAQQATTPQTSERTKTAQFGPASLKRERPAITNAIGATIPAEIVVIHQSDRLARPCSERSPFILGEGSTVNRERIRALPSLELDP